VKDCWLLLVSCQPMMIHWRLLLTAANRTWDTDDGILEGRIYL